MLTPCPLQQRASVVQGSAWEPTTALGSPPACYRLERLSRRMCSWPIMNMMLPPSAGPPAMCG